MLSSWGHSWPWYPISVLCDALKRCSLNDQSSRVTKTITYIGSMCLSQIMRFFSNWNTIFFPSLYSVHYKAVEKFLLHPKLYVSLWIHFQLTCDPSLESCNLQTLLLALSGSQLSAVFSNPPHLQCTSFHLGALLLQMHRESPPGSSSLGCSRYSLPPVSRTLCSQ